MTDDVESYMTVEDAAAYLRTSIRTVHRNGELGKVRTIRVGRRTLFHKGDIERMGKEQDVTNKPERPAQPQHRAEMVPASDLMDRIWELQSRLEQQAAMIGRLQGQLDQRLLPDEERDLQRRLATAEAERNMMRQRLEAIEQAQQAPAERPPWWRRLLP